MVCGYFAEGEAKAEMTRRPKRVSKMRDKDDAIHEISAVRKAPCYRVMKRDAEDRESSTSLVLRQAGGQERERS